MDWRAVLRWVLVAAAAPALLWLAIGLLLKQTTGLSTRAVLLDAAVAAQVGVILAVLGLAARRLGDTFHRVLLLAGGGALFGFLLAAGFGSWVARRNWGMNLSGNVVLEFLPHIAELASKLGWRGALLLALWMGASLMLARGWTIALTRREPPLAPPLQAAMIVLSIVSLVFMGNGASAGAVSDDPIFSLLRLEDYPALPPTPARMAAWLRDEEQRQIYDGGVPTRKHIVLILADGVRPDRMSLNGYGRETTPFLASLARGPGWAQVPLAYSAATESLGGIGSIVAGRSTRTMSGRSYGIVEYFARHGFRTHLLLNGVHSWHELRTMYGSKITTYKDLRHATPGIGIHDDRQILEWLKQIPPADGTPTFLMLFLMGTHESGALTPEEEFYSRAVPGAGQFSALPPGPDEWKQASDRYDDQMRATDRNLERIWKLLEEKGFLEDCFVLFSSDHGQMLGEHHAYGHGGYVWEDGIRIPMAVWTDGKLLAIDTRRTAWTPDVAPTLAEAAGLKPLPGWEGRSLFSTGPRTSYWTDSVWHTNHVRAAFHEAGGHRWKLHQDLDEDGVPVSERLFDVAADPSESTDRIADVAPELLRRMREIASAESVPDAERDLAASEADAHRD